MRPMQNIHTEKLHAVFLLFPRPLRGVAAVLSSEVDLHGKNARDLPFIAQDTEVLPLLRDGSIWTLGASTMDIDYQ